MLFRSPRCGRREGEAISIEKLRQLGVYKNHNSDTIGYHGDPNEERDRRPNPLMPLKEMCNC